MTTPRTHRRLTLIAGLPALALLLLAVTAGIGMAQEKEQVDRVVEEMKAAAGDDVLELGERLGLLGDDAVPHIEARLADTPPRVQVGLGWALLQLGHEEKAVAAWLDAAGAGDGDAAVRAGRLIEIHGDDFPNIEQRLDVLLDDLYEPRSRVAVAKALYVLTGSRRGVRVLETLVTAESQEVREDAAMSLAEVGRVAPVENILKVIAEEPTVRGRLARSLLMQEKLTREVERLTFQEGGGDGNPAPPAAGDPLLEELIAEIRDKYVDNGDKTEQANLINQAAKGMVGSLDPFSDYLTEEDVDRLRESLNRKYDGIGAVVNMTEDGWLQIVSPIYSGPAYKAGIRSLDIITKVEGESTQGKSLEDLVDILRGPRGTPVEVTVMRRGWVKERDITIVRDEIDQKTVRWELLPGDIGYLQLTSFGEESAAELRLAIQDMTTDGMKALVLDLRDNGGGLLDSAVEICDQFLSQGEMIVYTEGRNQQVAPRREYRATDRALHEDIPMAVLVNGASASASEITSGALKDHERATLIGQRTFGKGSVQNLFPVRATGGRTILKITTAYYYLPSGRLLHKRVDATDDDPWGVLPDVEVEPQGLDLWLVEEEAKVEEQEGFRRYLDTWWDAERETLIELADGDDRDAAAWPGFDKWYESLGVRASKDTVRRWLRDRVRRRVADTQGADFVTDVQEDVQLQAAILQVLDDMDADPALIPAYRSFADKNF